ncbi:MAG: hypothetical protein GC202_09940 [Alphaproteobacteria bacterium]|nr:hypothetical protein [Alphaproteobacteria bacterium]
MELGEAIHENPGAYARAYDAAFARARAALAADDIAPLADWFARDSAPPPRVIWRPTPADLPEGALRVALAYWQGLCGAAAIPDWRSLHAEDLGVEMVNLVVVDPVGGDFRFALYGSAIAQSAQHDYRGETVREMAMRTRTPAPLLYHVVYSLARERGIPVTTWSAAPVWQPIVAWHRLVLPFTFAQEPGRMRFLAVLRPDGERTVPDDAKRVARLRLDKG